MKLAAAGVKRMGEGYPIGIPPVGGEVLPCYCQKVRGLRDIICQTLKEAEWPYRDDGPPLAIGTSLWLDGMIVGGSIQIFEELGIVRVMAFGGVAQPGEFRPQLDEIIGVVNPTLLDVAFEIDGVLQMPVCRAVVRTDEDASAATVADSVIRVLGSVTANFAAVAPVFAGVAQDGLTTTEALRRMQRPAVSGSPSISGNL